MGDGKDFILEYLDHCIDGQYSYSKLWQTAEKYHRRFHDQLWSIADDQQQETGETIFGGDKHVLLLKKEPAECNWLTPPAQSP